MARRCLAPALALGLVGCPGGLQGCLEPAVSDAGDARAVVSGSIIYDGPTPEGDAPRGNTIIFLYAESAPPPPLGTGRPVTFAVVPRAALFSGNSTGGLRSAPFVISQVPAGRYTVRALLDVDGDFDPFSLTRASASRGDVGGMMLASTTPVPVPAVLEVGSGQVAGGVTLVLSAAQGRFASDAPAVALVGTPSFGAAITSPVRVRLQALQRSVDGPAVEAAGVAGAGQPGVMMTLADLDGDGVGDDSDGDGLVDVYPRVVLRRLADGDPTLTQDDPQATTIPCAVDPTPLLDVWPPPSGVPARGVWVDSLEALCFPVAVDARQSPAAPLPAIPPGSYAVLLIGVEGQVWRVPNELGPAAAPQNHGLLPQPLQTQSSVVTVTPQEQPAGRVAGTIRSAVMPTGPAWVLVFAAANPPPPQGTGRPVASTRVAASQFVQQEGGYAAPYVVRGLADGAYLVAFVLDQDASLDPRVEVQAQPSAGDVLAPPMATVQVQGGEALVDATPSSQVGVDPPRITGRTGTPLLLDQLQAGVTLTAASAPRLRAPGGPEARFHVTFRNAGADDDGDGQPDVWPRVLLRRVAVDPQDVSGLDPSRTVVVPAAVDLAPLGMALRGAVAGSVISTTRVRLNALPRAVDATNPQAVTVLPSVPAGTYALILMTQHGQVFAPALLEETLRPISYALADGAAPPVAVTDTAGMLVTVPARPVPLGGISGTLLMPSSVAIAATGTAWVLAFPADRPGPPDGAGVPAGVAQVPAQLFADMGGTLVAPYSITGLPAGEYVVQALLDQDRDFSFLGGLRTQATAGDVVGAHLEGMRVTPVTVAGAVTADVVVTLVRALSLGPPAFRVGRHEVSGTLTAPVNLSLEALRDADPAVAPGGVLDVEAAEVAFAVTLRDANADGIPDDADGDNLPDLYPRVLLQRADDADSSGLTVARGSAAVTIPAMPDPARYLPALLAGAPALVVGTLDTVVVPLALREDRSAYDAVPSGAYATTVLEASGQNWRVPNLLSPQAALAGGGVTTQGTLLNVESAAFPSGALEGTLDVPAGNCGDVVVAVRTAGAGAVSAFLPPAGLALVRAQRDAAGACVAAPQTWRVRGLPAGRYTVSAFVDLDADFNALWSTMRGPSRGDLLGGHLDAGGASITLDVTNVALTGITLTFPVVAPLEKPAFALEGGAPASGQVSGAAVRTVLTTLAPGGLDAPLARVAGAGNLFTTVEQMGAQGSVVWPLVMLARLDDGDARGLRLQQPLQLVLGNVDESLFTAATDDRVEVVFSPVRVDETLRPLGPASPGRYAILVLNQTGQTWQLPNELSPALAAGGMGFPGAAGQGAVWTFLP